MDYVRGSTSTTLAGNAVFADECLEVHVCTHSSAKTLLSPLLPTLEKADCVVLLTPLLITLAKE